MSIDSIKKQLEEAQCLDALDTIRGIAWLQRVLWAYHNANMQGQVHMTHTQSFMDHLQHCLDLVVTKYYAAQVALLGLQSARDWEKTL